VASISGAVVTVDETPSGFRIGQRVTIGDGAHILAFTPTVANSTPYAIAARVIATGEVIPVPITSGGSATAQAIVEALKAAGDGIAAFVADPAQLDWREQQLWCEGVAIDLVYNRLTDFALSEPAHAHLREAYLDDAVVLTPHPRAHALWADKRNLAQLCNANTLQTMGVPESTQAVLLAGIPHTEVVTPGNAERFWAERKQFFFKPFAGFGGKAAYRGDKLTHRVWAEIAAGGYIAQAWVAPGERTISGGDSAQVLKFDVRNYVYDGQVQSLAARLYQGQTTNFRTPGGGFSPVYVTP
jgi:hypothetical protein